MNCAGLFNFDIHGGNYLFADEVVHMLDWGGVVETIPEVQLDFPGFIDACRANDLARMRRYLANAEFYTEASLERHGSEIFKRQREVYFRPFLADKSFRFTPEFAAEVVRTQINVELMSGMAKPKHSVRVLNIRFIWSLYSLLGRLYAEADWGRIVEEELRRTKRAAA